MSKNPEEMAEEYAEIMSFDVIGHQRGFLAGVEAVLKEAKKISKEVWRGGDIVSIVELDELEGLFELGKLEQS